MCFHVFNTSPRPTLDSAYISTFGTLLWRDTTTPGQGRAAIALKQLCSTYSTPEARLYWYLVKDYIAANVHHPPVAFNSFINVL